MENLNANWLLLHNLTVTIPPVAHPEPPCLTDSLSRKYFHK